jgi:transposase
MRYELTDNDWSAIKPMLPNKPRGAPRVNDRRVLNGIFLGRLGAICRTTSVRTRPTTIVSFAGDEQAPGPRSCARSPPLTTPRCR